MNNNEVFDSTIKILRESKPYFTCDEMIHPFTNDLVYIVKYKKYENSHIFNNELSSNLDSIFFEYKKERSLNKLS